MMSRCVDIPISWLRLEQLALGELAGADAAGARDHLEGCAACRAAFERIGADRRSLRPLRLEAPRRWLRWGVAGSALVAAAAALLLFVMPREPIDRGPAAPRLSRTVAIKGGGELVVGLVRERGGRIDREPTHFAAGDRFKIAVTCSEPGRVELVPVVSQAGERFHPLGETVAVDCRNDTLLPGAFEISGADPARICVSERGGGGAACLELEASD